MKNLFNKEPKVCEVHITYIVKSNKKSKIYIYYD